MKYILVILGILFGTTLSTYAHQVDTLPALGKKTDKPAVIRMSCGPSHHTMPVLWVITISRKEYFVQAPGLGDLIKPEWIETITVLKSTNAVQEYGDRAKNGVIEINLKKQVPPDIRKKLKTLSQLI